MDDANLGGDGIERRELQRKGVVGRPTASQSEGPGGWWEPLASRAMGKIFPKSVRYRMVGTPCTFSCAGRA